MAHSPTAQQKTALRISRSSLERAFDSALNVCRQAAIQEFWRQIDILEAGADPRGSGASAIATPGPKGSHEQPDWWIEVSDGSGGPPKVEPIAYRQALQITAAQDVDFLLNEAIRAAYIRNRDRPITALCLLRMLAVACANAGGNLFHTHIAELLPDLVEVKSDRLLAGRIQQYIDRLKRQEGGLGQDLYHRIFEKSAEHRIWIHWKGFSYLWVRRTKSNQGPYFP